MTLSSAIAPSTRSPTTTLGFFNLTAAEFTRRVEATTDAVIAAVSGINRPDGVPIVDIIYRNGEVQIAAPSNPQPAGRANDDWFMTTHYPQFAQAVQAGGRARGRFYALGLFHSL